MLTITATSPKLISVTTVRKSSLQNTVTGFFPSAGIGWIVSNESFFSGIKNIVSNLKLKMTYGLVGNDAISDPNDRFFYLSDVNLNDGNRGYTFGNDFERSLSRIHHQPVFESQCYLGSG